MQIAIIKEIKNKTIQRIVVTKSWFFEKMKKINCQAYYLKEGNTKINKTRSKYKL